jgi:hypothetical protein
MPKQNGWWWDAAGNPKPNDGSEPGGETDVARLNKTHAVLPIGDKSRVVTFGELEEFPGATPAFRA